MVHRPARWTTMGVIHVFAGVTLALVGCACLASAEEAVAVVGPDSTLTGSAPAANRGSAVADLSPEELAREKAAEEEEFDFLARQQRLEDLDDCNPTKMSRTLSKMKRGCVAASPSVRTTELQDDVEAGRRQAVARGLIQCFEAIVSALDKTLERCDIDPRFLQERVDDFPSDSIDASASSHERMRAASTASPVAIVEARAIKAEMEETLNDFRVSLEMEAPYGVWKGGLRVCDPKQELDESVRAEVQAAKAAALAAAGEDGFARPHPAAMLTSYIKGLQTRVLGSAGQVLGEEPQWVTSDCIPMNDYV